MIRRLLKKFLGLLPAPIQGLLRAPYHAFLRLERAVTYEVWTLRGKELDSGEPLSVAFAGSEELKNYHAKLMFQAAPDECFLGRRRVWSVKRTATAADGSVSVILYEVPDAHEPFFRRPGCFRTPVWIRTDLDLSGDLRSSIHTSKYRSMTQRIRRAAFTWEVSTDDASFDDFYSNYYMPYISRRHGGSLLIQNHEALKRLHREHGELLWVLRDGTRIAGVVLEYAGGDAHSVQVGIREPVDEHLKLGASDAIYFFTFTRAKERGLRSANLGHSHAYLSDGVLQRKLQMGAYFSGVRMKGKGTVAVEVLALPDGLRRFFEQNPFIHFDGTEYRVVEVGAAGTPLKMAPFAGVAKTDKYEFEDFPRWRASRK